MKSIIAFTLLIYFPLAIHSQSSSYIEILFADQTNFEKRDCVIDGITTTCESTILIGDVGVQYGASRIFADKIDYKATQKLFEAIGNVRILTQDGAKIKCDYMKENNKEQKTTFRGNVKILAKEDTLFSEKVIYDGREKKYYYNNYGEVKSPSKVSKSKKGTFNVEDNTILLVKEVVVVDSNYTLYSDSIFFDDKEKKLNFIAPTKLIDSPRTLITDKGYYDIDKGIISLSNRPVIIDENSVITADSLYFDERRQIRKGIGNFEFKDTAKSYRLQADYGFFDDSLGNFLSVGNSHFTYESDKDKNTHLVADTIFGSKIIQPKRIKPDAIFVNSISPTPTKYSYENLKNKYDKDTLSSADSIDYINDSLAIAWMNKVYKEIAYDTLLNTFVQYELSKYPNGYNADMWVDKLETIEYKIDRFFEDIDSSSIKTETEADDEVEDDPEKTEEVNSETEEETDDEVEDDPEKTEEARIATEAETDDEVKDDPQKTEQEEAITKKKETDTTKREKESLVVQNTDTSKVPKKQEKVPPPVIERVKSFEEVVSFDSFSNNKGIKVADILLNERFYHYIIRDTANYYSFYLEKQEFIYDSLLNQIVAVALDKSSFFKEHLTPTKSEPYYNYSDKTDASFSKGRITINKKDEQLESFTDSTIGFIEQLGSDVDDLLYSLKFSYKDTLAKQRAIREYNDLINKSVSIYPLKPYTPSLNTDSNIKVGISVKEIFEGELDNSTEANKPTRLATYKDSTSNNIVNNKMTDLPKTDLADKKKNTFKKPTTSLAKDNRENINFVDDSKGSNTNQKTKRRTDLSNVDVAKSGINISSDKSTARLPSDTSLNHNDSMSMDSILADSKPKINRLDWLLQTDTFYQSNQLKFNTDNFRYDSLEVEDIYLIQAYRNVRIYEDSLQIVCDSLSYDQSLGLIRLFDTPYIWVQNNIQFWGDSILIKTKNNNIEQVYSSSNPKILHYDIKNYYNHVKGDEILVKFKEEKLEALHAKTNTKAIYNIINDSTKKISLIDNTDAINMSIFFKNGGINKISFMGDIVGVLYPAETAKPQHKSLDGFEWRDDLKINAYEELFSKYIDIEPPPEE